MKKKVGRPKKLKEKTVPVTVSIYQSQRELFGKLGGSEWLRNQLELEINKDNPYFINILNIFSKYKELLIKDQLNTLNDNDVEKFYNNFTCIGEAPEDEYIRALHFIANCLHKKDQEDKSD